MRFGSGGLRLLVLLAFALGLGGCAGLRVYDSARDQKGQAASKAWSGVKLDEVIAAERTNLDKILAEESETQDKLAFVLREYELKSLFASQSIRDGLNAAITTRLEKLLGDVAMMKKFQDARLEARKTAQQLVEQSGPLRLLGLPVPTCDRIAIDDLPKIRKWQSENPSGFQSAAVRSTLETIRQICSAAPAGSEQQLLKGFGGELGFARDEKQAADRQLAARKEESRVAQEAFDKANKEHSEAVALATADPQRAAKIKAATEKLSDAAKDLDELSDAFSIQLISQERLKAIDEFANVIVQTAPGKDPPVTAGRAAKAAALLPALFDDAEKSLAEARKPLVLPWTLQRDHQQLNLEAARRDIAASEAVVRLSGELVDVLLLQAESLTLALDELKAASARMDEPMLAALRSGTTAEKQAIYFAATRYLDVVGRLESKRYRTEYARLGAYHERTLSLSEVSVKQWESLIGIAVAQLAQDSASGFKPEDFASLLNTLGIFYIGRGVNK
jgi:hypothetical protein